MEAANGFHHSDVCGNDLESLIGRGHVLIAKVLQISNEIPSCFRYDYTLQPRHVASMQGPKKKSVLSTMWKKMTSKKSELKMLRRQVLSYTKLELTGDQHQHHQHPNADDTNSDVAMRDQATSAVILESSGSLQEKYKAILADFAYLADPERFDSHLHILEGEESDEDRRKLIIQQEHLEREFVAEFGEILGKFHAIFNDILAYYHDIQQFAKQLQSGHYVQYSVESLLQHSRGRQYLCELLYLYGNILILLDLYIPGTIRERLIIANHRYCSNPQRSNISAPIANVANFEQLCKMFQRSEDSPTGNQKLVSHLIPGQDYFLRMPLQSTLIEPIVECLIAHNIYPVKDLSYPSYDHRTTKLANQASIIFVILHFQANFFTDEDKLRQVIDRFFANNWMVPLYNGELVDLFLEWNERFPCAKLALEFALPESKKQTLNSENALRVKQWTDEIKLYLNQSSKSSDLFVMENIDKLKNCIRNGNAALRWRILHRSSKVFEVKKNKSDSVERLAPKVTDREIVNLFLLVSGLEANIMEALRRIILDKPNIWTQFKKHVVMRMQQLSNHFHGKDDLSDDKNDEIGAWFGNMSEEVEVLVFNKSCPDVQFCIDSLNEIKMLDVIDRNAQVKTIINQAEGDLLRMVNIENITDDTCCIIENITECGYARVAMEYYVPIFHAGVTADPKSVGMLRPSFIKIASFLQKISICRGTTFAMEYHSNAMLSFVKEILDVIPISIFSTYGMIVDSNEKSLSRLPTKIDVDTLADYTLFDDRYKLSKLTYELCILTEGIIDMEETMFGDLKMNPQQLLEEGLRRELVRQISMALHTNLQFSLQTDRSRKSLLENQQAFVGSLQVLARRMEGFHRTIVWLQDFLRIDGLSIYIQESTRVIWHSVYLEMGTELLTKPPELPSVPEIPVFPRTINDPKSLSFMGRTLTALVNLLDPKLSTFSRSFDGWYFHKDGNVVLEGETIHLLKKSLGVQGIIGLEVLICHRVTKELESLYKFYGNAIGTYGVMLEKFRDGVFPEWQAPKHGHSFYTAAIAKVGKLMVPLLSFFFRIGQLQLLRKMLKMELNLGSRIDAIDLLQVATIINGDNIAMIRGNSDNLNLDESTIAFIKEASSLHQAVGGGDPMATVFKRTDALEGLPVLITLFIVHYMPKVFYDHEFQALRGKEDEESFDGWTIISGIGTVLKQFNPAYTKATFALLGQYVTCATKAHLSKAQNDESQTSSGVCMEARNTLVFLIQLQSIFGLDHSVLHDHVPQFMIEMYELMD